MDRSYSMLGSNFGPINDSFCGKDQRGGFVIPSTLKLIKAYPHHLLSRERARPSASQPLDNVVHVRSFIKRGSKGNNAPKVASENDVYIYILCFSEYQI